MKVVLLIVGWRKLTRFLFSYMGKIKTTLPKKSRLQEFEDFINGNLQVVQVAMISKQSDALLNTDFLEFHETYRFDEQNCFKNIQRWMLHSCVGFTYVEGYIHIDGSKLQIQHAWLKRTYKTIHGDSITHYFDPTMQLYNDDSKIVYCSIIELEFEYVMGKMEDRGFYGGLLHDYFKDLQGI